MMSPAAQRLIECGRQFTRPAKSWLRCGRPISMLRARNAILPDVERIHAIITPYAEKGTLLPRTIPELCENVRDFVVAEDDGERVILGCVSLHLYAPHLADSRP